MTGRAEIEVGTFGALLANSEDGVLTSIASRVVSNGRRRIDRWSDDGNRRRSDRSRRRRFGLDLAAFRRNSGSSRTSDLSESVSSRMEFTAEIDAEPE